MHLNILRISYIHTTHQAERMLWFVSRVSTAVIALMSRCSKTILTNVWRMSWHQCEFRTTGRYEAPLACRYNQTCSVALCQLVIGLNNHNPISRPELESCLRGGCQANLQRHVPGQYAEALAASTLIVYSIYYGFQEQCWTPVALAISQLVGQTLQQVWADTYTQESKLFNPAALQRIALILLRSATYAIGYEFLHTIAWPHAVK